jgi:hypothetical protein
MDDHHFNYIAKMEKKNKKQNTAESWQMYYYFH